MRLDLSSMIIPVLGMPPQWLIRWVGTHWNHDIVDLPTKCLWFKIYRACCYLSTSWDTSKYKSFTPSQLCTSNDTYKFCFCPSAIRTWNSLRISVIAKISLTSPIVIKVPTTASLAVETKGILFLWLAHLCNKNNVCKQISFLFLNHYAWI